MDSDFSRINSIGNNNYQEHQKYNTNKINNIEDFKIIPEFKVNTDVKDFNLLKRLNIIPNIENNLTTKLKLNSKNLNQNLANNFIISINSNKVDQIKKKLILKTPILWLLGNQI